MKRVSYNLFALLLLTGTFLTVSVLARPVDEKRKTIEKSYNVNGNTEVSIRNSFGRVHINTWDKNQFEVNIEIVVRSDRESRTQEMLDRIKVNIEDSNPKTSLSFQTTIGNNNFGNNSGRNNSFEINYTVSMPKTNNLELKNSFGDVYVGDLSGRVDLDVQYGNLNAGKFNGTSGIKLAFGSGFSEIEMLAKSDLKVSYSKLGIDEMGEADINSQFSTLEVGNAGRLDLVGKYGEIDIKEIDYLDANVNFSSFEIEKLNKALDLDIDYGGSNNIGISSTVERVDIKNSFGPLNLEIASGVNAGIKAYLSFCDMNYDEDRIKFDKVIKEHTSSEYEGKIGNGGSKSVIISSKYGSVRIR